MTKQEKDKILQKMWNELYHEEDKYEKRIQEDDNEVDIDDWLLYRSWLQVGHAIGIKVISEWDEDENNSNCL
jgi:hypothetical protein